ncbi:hypothetical protein [Tsukamurella sp. 1534]|uniref:hypothetical protein n=1 Tax=Tsukamurella sp. 1534 TaxID=1151061 RepID=UPI0002D58DC8|nr:hypothetical protein [Tsukamurella sp. 1534]
MSTYTEITEKLTDQWVAAVEKATDSLPAGIDRAAKAPSFDLPDLSSLLPGSVVAGLPDAKEVIETNYRVAERLLAAHRDFTLAVIEKSVPKAADA